MASDHYVVADHRTGADGSFIADLDVFAENRARADGYVLADLSGGGNDGGGMNAAIAVGVAEQPRGSRKGEARLRGNQQGLRWRWRRSSATNSPAITAAADEPSAVSRCWASSTKTRLSLVADCRLETLVTVMEPSPRRWQPSFSARSRRVCFMAPYCRFPGRVCTTRRWLVRGRGSAPSPSGARAPLPHERRSDQYSGGWPGGRVFQRRCTQSHWSG